MTWFTSLAALVLVVVSTAGCKRPGNESAESVCVAHMEGPRYPFFARAARLGAEVTVTIQINHEGKVVGAQVPANSVFHGEIERNVRTWTFSHLPRDAKFPISRTVLFEFRIEGKRSDACPQVTLDLPDRVRITAHPLPLESGR